MRERPHLQEFWSKHLAKVRFGEGKMLEIEVINLIDGEDWCEIDVKEDGQWIETTQGDPRVILSDLRSEFLLKFSKGE